jgi:hypothetical protein
VKRAEGADISLEAFAATVLRLARGADVTLFGDRKAFICTVLEAWYLDDALTCPTRAAFQAQLFAAHKAQLLVLCRADLVAAMDPELVRWSEVRWDATAKSPTFHFVALV